MHASEVLQRCLADGFAGMHAGRRRCLLHAVEALVAGRRLTLMDLARAWPGAERVRAPLKALDRLLSNRWLQAEQDGLYAGMARWLATSPHPVIVVDWSDLKADGSWHLLRAAVPVGGRSIPILDLVAAGSEQGSPAAELRFLRRLKTILPVGCQPILVTDAGFRAPWFRAVSALGWLWLGRVRGTVHLKPTTVPDTPDQWVSCKTLYDLTTSAARDLGLMDMVRSRPWTCRVVIYAKPAQGRKDRNQHGRPARSKRSRANAARAREPWLLAAAPALAHLPAHQLVALYTRRMQIELSFRDLKSHCYGQGFEDSLTRKGPRLAILLLLHTLAAFACWLVGRACEARGLADWLAPFHCARRLYSIPRLGREALVRSWPTARLRTLVDQLKQPPYLPVEILLTPA